MTDMKNALLVGVLAVAAIAIGATTGTALAGPKGPKPPKAVIDQLRGQLENPPADPDDTGGVVDPAKDQGVALILRDPQTGDVLRDPATGLPQVARDAAGNVKLFKGNEVPDDQKQAQAKHQEKMQRAGAGDVQAQNELNAENTLTANAVKDHPNGK